jgi:hypothetical protein
MDKTNKACASLSPTNHCFEGEIHQSYYISDKNPVNFLLSRADEKSTSFELTHHLTYQDIPTIS